MTATTKAMEALEIAVRARVPLIGIETTEEARIVSCIRELADRPVVSLSGEGAVAPERLVFRWTYTGGVILERPKYKDEDGLIAPLPDDLDSRYAEAERWWKAEGRKPTNQPYSAVSQFVLWARGDAEPGNDLDKGLMTERASVLIMHDLHRFLGAGEGSGDTASIRAMRDLFYGLLPTKSYAAITAPELSALGDSNKEIVVIHWPLPDVDELTAMVRVTAERVNVPVADDVKNGGAEIMGQALTALTWTQAGFVLRQAMVKAKQLSAEVCTPIISQMKAGILRQQQGIKLIEPEPLDHIGGLDLLKEAVASYPDLLNKEARDANVRPPRAILLSGPPGTGKSLACKTVGGGRLPILRWSPQESKNKYLGETAANVRGVLDAADAIDLCILWIEEINLIFNKGSEKHETSDETQQQVLEWMQERTSHCIVVATTNYPGDLPEPLRDRFEDRWFVDLPRNTAEALQVFTIHLGKRGLQHLCTAEELPAIAASTVRNNINPRGIEQAIEAAHRVAFTAKRDLAIEDLTRQIETRAQMTRNTINAIEQMRQEAATWSMNASSARPDVKVGDTDDGNSAVEL